LWDNLSSPNAIAKKSTARNGFLTAQEFVTYQANNLLHLPVPATAGSHLVPQLKVLHPPPGFNDPLDEKLESLRSTSGELQLGQRTS
jgi:hypothetical protein